MALADYAREGARNPRQGESLLEHAARRFDYERLIEQVLEPHRAGRLALGPHGEAVDPDALVIVEGPTSSPAPRLSLDG